MNIAIFRDRVEVRSPGLLYGGLTIERIRKEMVSERRNEVIADLFHRVQFIEKWGRGIKMMLSKEPDTVFKEVGTHFITVFKRKDLDGTDTTQKTTQKGSGKTVEKTVEKIINAIRKNPKITQKELAAITGLKRRGIEWNIDKLKKEGRLRRVGPAKGGHWEILEN